MATIGMDVKGLEELVKDLSPDLLNKPMKNFFMNSTKELQADIRGETPQYSGKLKRSLRRSIDGRPLPLFGKVYSPLFYALFVEKGTGAHYPPRAALAGWAAAHGIADAKQVVKSIGARGTKGRYMFAKGSEKAAQKIGGYLAEAEREIEKGLR